MRSVDFVLHIIPDCVVGAFAQGDILQVLLFSILFGFALMALGDKGAPVRTFVDDVAHAMFGVIALIVMKPRRSARSARWPTRSAATDRRRSATSPG